MMRKRKRISLGAEPRAAGEDVLKDPEKSRIPH
jgi:hypothetical protein